MEGCEGELSGIVQDFAYPPGFPSADTSGGDPWPAPRTLWVGRQTSISARGGHCPDAKSQALLKWVILTPDQRNSFFKDGPVRLAIIGSGYVGLVAAVCFAELGHEVTCVDNDRQKIERLQQGEAPIYEEYLQELLAKHRGRRLEFTTELKPALAGVAAVFIAVGTPATEQGEADMSYVEAVSRAIAQTLDGYKVVVEKSTVPVFTHDWIRKAMLLNGAAPGSFDVASNPEFLREGSAVRDFLYPDRIVLGVDNQRSSRVLHKIYEPLSSGRYYQEGSRIPGPAEPKIPPVIV